MKSLSTKTIGILLTLLAFSFTSLGDVATKALTAHFNVFAVGYYMNLFTISFLTPIIIYNGGVKKAFQTQSLKFHTLRSLFMTGIFLCIIYALANLPMTKTYTLLFTTPFILNILALIILKEKISFIRWLSIIVAFIGILIALRPGVVPLNYGSLAAMGVAFFLACATITVKFISPNDKWLPYICYPMLIQTPILAVLAFINDAPLIPSFLPSALLWLMLGGFAFAVGLSILPQAVKRIDASVFGALIYIAFPWGILYGYFIFNDVPDLWTLAGAVIIIASGLFLIYRERIEDSKLLKTTKNTKGTKL